MPRTATKTASVFIRLEPDTKEQAEMILDQLGISMSNAVSMFIKQIVLQKGIPFEMKLPERRPLELGSMSAEQFNMELRKGFEDIEKGNVLSADDVEAEIKGIKADYGASDQKMIN